jgi:hypothetical protein
MTQSMAPIADLFSMESLKAQDGTKNRQSVIVNLRFLPEEGLVHPGFFCTGTIHRR